LSIYDTFEPAKQVLLKADEILYCGMISGRKKLHGENHPPVDFLSHESFIMAPGEAVAINFPEASKTNPTSCLTLGISKFEELPKAETVADYESMLSWNLDAENLKPSAKEF